MASSADLHGAQGIGDLCARLGSEWECRGTESAGGFFLELLKVNSSSAAAAKHCPSFILSEEQKCGLGGRAVLYAAGLGYCFFGLAVITGVYMKALDCIVKQTRRTVREDPVTGGRLFKEERIWNAAVADITLLALGTCAPQVSLAIVDTIQHLGDSSDPNELGAGTLIGSAAFNLFPILAVCVVSTKAFELKYIRDMGVYIVELIWSFWAYVWLFIILQVWTPNVITIREALLTIGQFPLLVLHAYIQDRRWIFLSIPWKVPDQPPAFVGSAELAVISQESKLWTRYLSLLHPFEAACQVAMARRGRLGMLHVDLSEPSSTKHGLSESSNAAPEDDVFEDLDTGSMDGFLNRDETVSSRSYTWREIGALWRDQFSEAMTVSGADDGTGRKLPPSVLNLILHPFVSYWKISFAFIPPVELFHGWVAFIFSICFITAISYTVVRLANLFHCVTGLNSYILALTVLATGTSFPNLIASKIAAEEYETADSAIANINASNCINVFIGFGIPWCISTVYDVALHEKLVLPSSELGLVLAIYFATAILAITALSARRHFLGGELGGPRRWAWLSAALFMLLWLIFLLFACLANRSI